MGVVEAVGLLTRTWSGAMVLDTLGISQARTDVARAMRVSFEMLGTLGPLSLMLAVVDAGMKAERHVAAMDGELAPGKAMAGSS